MEQISHPRERKQVRFPAKSGYQKTKARLQRPPHGIFSDCQGQRNEKVEILLEFRGRKQKHPRENLAQVSRHRKVRGDALRDGRLANS